MLRAARGKYVVFTGAGISTQSGIPEFRSPGGIWTQMAPIDFEDFVSSAEMRKEAWRGRFAMEGMFASVSPNAGHRRSGGAVAARNREPCHHAEHRRIASDSEFRREKVIELHGNTQYAKCLNCGTREELAPIRNHFEHYGEAPGCSLCGGLLQDGHDFFRTSDA